MNESLNYGSRKCLEKVVECASAKFNESVDVVVNLGVDSRKSDEQVRGVVVLPKGIGKSIRVAVFGQGEHVLEAERAGADIVGGEDLVEEVKRGKKLDVDWCVTTPGFMPMVAPIAKVLGSKGLMPNPKFGTVTSNVGETVKIIKSGQIKFRADQGGIVHGKIGNIKFSIDDLLENLKVLIRVIKENKPMSVKGIYFKGIFLNSTMGKAYKVGKIEEII